MVIRQALFFFYLLLFNFFAANKKKKHKREMLLCRMAVSQDMYLVSRAIACLILESGAAP